jgi:hypothetical protein
LPQHEFMKPTERAAEALLIITGSMGSGKTTVLAEASDILISRNVAHAAIDLDALGTAYLTPAVDDDGLLYRNLQSVWGNCAHAGLTRLLLAAAIENRAALDRCRLAVPGARPVVCRLTASTTTMQNRVRMREPGMLQRSFVDRVVKLNALLNQAKVEDFTVDNDSRPVTDVAREMLTRAGWLA